MARQPIRIRVKLGKENQYNVYIWRASESRWIDYTANTFKIRIECRKNELKSLSLALAGIITDEQKADITKGNYVAITSNRNLVSKFVLEQPRYHTDRTVDVIAYESNGNNKKQLRKELTGDVRYTDTNISSILTQLCSGIIELDQTDNGGNNKISPSFYYDNLIKAISRCCELADKIWWIEHKDVYLGELGTDVLHVVDANDKFEDTATWTFTSHGANTNIYNLTYDNESESLINDVIVESTISTLGGLKTIRSEIFHATTKRTTLSSNLDTYLDEEIDAEQTTFKISDLSVFYTLPIIIQIGNEKMQVTSTNSSTSEITVVRGYDSTDTDLHHSGEDVCILGADGNNAHIYVDDINALNNPTSIYIGSELLTVTSIKPDYLVCTRSDSPYSHLIGAPVYTYQDASGTYSKTSPEAGSSIYDNELRSRKVIDKLAMTKNDLDLRGKAIIDEYKDGVERIRAHIINPRNYLGILDIGDGASITDTQSGLSNALRNVVGYTFEYIGSKEELQVIFTDEEFVFATELSESVEEDISKAIGQTAHVFQESFESYTGGGDILVVKKDMSLRNKKIIIYSNDNDAITLKGCGFTHYDIDGNYIGCLVGTSDGISIDSSFNPASTSHNLGTSTNYWNEVHYHTLVAHSPSNYKGDALDIIDRINLENKESLPKFIRSGGNKREYGIKMDNLVSILLKAIKELKEETTKLKQEVNSLKSKKSQN